MRWPKTINCISASRLSLRQFAILFDEQRFCVLEPHTLEQMYEEIIFVAITLSLPSLLEWNAFDVTLHQLKLRFHTIAFLHLLSQNNLQRDGGYALGENTD